MKIFATGTTGFIGRRFLARLLGTLGPDDRVYALVRGECPVDDPRILPLPGALDGLGQYRREILECDYVFHLAANASFGNTTDYEADNYRPVVALTEILKSSTALKNFVFISTIGAVDRAKGDRCAAPLTPASPPAPTSAYGRSKLKAEHHVSASGIPFTLIRPAWVYGRDMRANSHVNTFVPMVYRRSPVLRLHFPGRVSLIHVEDLAQALAGALHNPAIIGKTYFAETEALALGDIFAIIAREIRGKAPLQIPVPSLRWLVGRLHSRLPLAVSNLFIDYLTARDDAFRADFRLPTVRTFAENVRDVIESNPWNGSWIVTGANSGIGYELATQLQALGKRLILIDKRIDNLGAFAGQDVIQADLGDSREREAAAKRVRDRRIFCLINNAGIGARGSIRDLDGAKIQEMIDVNVAYPVFFTRSLLGSLIRDRSIIVNVASSVAYNPLPNMSIYSATKAFLANWSESLTYELRDTNRVLTVSPAGTRTRFQDTAGVKVLNEGRGLLSPAYVAGRILHAVLRTRKTVLGVGASSRVLLILSRVLPRSWNIVLWGKLFEKLR